MTLRRLAGMLLALWLLSACEPLPPPPLRVALGPWMGHDSLILARERNWLDAADARLVEVISSSESARALRNGLVEAAGLTLDEALRIADEGVDIRIVALFDTSHGADALLVRPDIRRAADLRGKSIAIEQSALGAYLLERFLALQGLALSDIRIARVEADRHETYLLAGKADAVITYEPIKSRLLARGYAAIFDSSEIPGEIVDVLAVRAETLAAEAPRVIRLLQAMERGRLELVQRQWESAALLGAAYDLEAPKYLAALNGIRPATLADAARELGTPEGALQQRAQAQAALLVRRGYIRKLPDWRVLLVPGPARAALRAEDARP